MVSRSWYLERTSPPGFEFTGGLWINNINGRGIWAFFDFQFDTVSRCCFGGIFCKLHTLPRTGLGFLSVATALFWPWDSSFEYQISTSPSFHACGIRIVLQHNICRNVELSKLLVFLRAINVSDGFISIVPIVHRRLLAWPPASWLRTSRGEAL